MLWIVAVLTWAAIGTYMTFRLTRFRAVDDNDNRMIGVAFVYAWVWIPVAALVVGAYVR